MSEAQGKAMGLEALESRSVILPLGKLKSDLVTASTLWKKNLPLQMCFRMYPCQWQSELVRVGTRNWYTFSLF
ncbi:MAG: hypothetical protein PHY41_05685 [Candidatus Cloacimonetes bacterium]|nr:hypothetical protein [Candidatus Cloacimonadota bacterium]